MHRAAALKLPAGLKSGRRLGVDDGLKQLLVCGELYPAVLVGGVPSGCQKCLSPCSVHTMNNLRKMADEEKNLL